MSWGIVAGVAGSLVGGAVSSRASRRAADTQSDAAERASDAQLTATRESNALQERLAREQMGMQREQFDRVTSMQEPFRRSGLAATNRLMHMLGIDLGGAAGGGEGEAAIRARLAPQFSGSNEVSSWSNPTALEAAVRAEMDKSAGAPAGPGAGSGDPQFGSLMRRFSMQDYQEDPGYQFRLSEGQRALDRASAAGGRFNSGRSMKDIVRFGQGQASQEYGNAYDRFNADGDRTYNRLAGVAGTGQTASNNVGAAGQAYASGAGNAQANYGQSAGSNIMAGGAARASAYTGAGNAQAAGQVGSANAWNNAIGQGYGMWQQNQLMDLITRRQPGGYENWRTTGNGMPPG